MTQNADRANRQLGALLFAACILSGSLAGGNIYRYIIEVPAWRHLDIMDWEAYSRYADLGNGIYLFPIEAISCTLLLITASIIILRNKAMYSPVLWPVYAAAVFAVVGLVLTFFAAPVMLSLKAGNNDPERVQEVFNKFHFLGLYRAVAQVLSFCACVWAMGKYNIKKQ